MRDTPKENRVNGKSRIDDHWLVVAGILIRARKPRNKKAYCKYQVTSRQLMARRQGPPRARTQCPAGEEASNKKNNVNGKSRFDD